MTWWIPYAAGGALIAFVGLYGYNMGAASVEREWDKSREVQREGDAAQSEGLEAYRKKADMTNIRKGMHHEITVTSCPVISDRRLRLYQAAGVRDNIE